MAGRQLLTVCQWMPGRRVDCGTCLMMKGDLPVDVGDGSGLGPNRVTSLGGWSLADPAVGVSLQ
jgi:hypothetical protein